MNKIEQFHKQCIVCHSTEIKNLKRYSKDYLVQCKNCDLVFSQKIPSYTELYNYYQNYSIQEDYSISLITLQRYKEILNSLESFRQTNRILDVGCGQGDFLMVAKELGWEVYGIEFSEKLYNYCSQRKLNVFRGTLELHANQLPTFDIIFSFEVLEHINTPNTEIQLFNKLLRKGGAVYVTTPNFNSIMRFLLKDKYNAICYPEHLTYFTPKTLKYSFEKNGFSTKWLRTTGISVSRLVNSINPSKNHTNSIESEDEKLRKTIESKKFLKILKGTANTLLSITKTGLTIKGLFTKK